jgi:hypothetical protein
MLHALLNATSIRKQHSALEHHRVKVQRNYERGIQIEEGEKHGKRQARPRLPV